MDFRNHGTISLSKNSKSHPIHILRDTGAAQSILFEPSLPGVENNYTGEDVILQYLSAQSTLKLAHMYLDCPLVKGKVKVAITSQPLPLKGIHLILGNDLTGSLVVPNLTVVDTPLIENPTQEIEKDQPYLFPTCAVTRAQACAKVDVQPHLPPVVDKLSSQVMSKENLIESQKADSTLTRCRCLAEDESIDSPRVLLS